MVELAVICEGKTERLFAEQLLAPHLSAYGVELSAIEVGVDCKQPGGNVTFERILHDLGLLLRSYDKVTTLVDFFRLGAGWAGLNSLVSGMSSQKQAEAVEAVALKDAAAAYPDVDIPNRFIPNEAKCSGVRGACPSPLRIQLSPFSSSNENLSGRRNSTKLGISCRRMASNTPNNFLI